MKILKGTLSALCGAALFVMCGTAAKADEWNKKTVITFSDAVEIPGQVLPAGTYVFKLLDSASDRHIVQIWTEDQRQIIVTILAVPAQRPEPRGHTSITFDERRGDSPMAVRTWFYPGDSIGQEFVYHYSYRSSYPPVDNYAYPSGSH